MQQPAKKICIILNNNDGYILVSTLLILAILTIIGVSGTKTTDFELKIAFNEKQAYQQFYAADSGWKQSGSYLNTKASAPDIINMTFNTGDTKYDWDDEFYQIIRNYGDGTDGTLNENFPENAKDGVVANISYWYRVRYENDSQATGFGTNYRDFLYEVLCNAGSGSTFEVGTQVQKVYKVGY